MVIRLNQSTRRTRTPKLKWFLPHHLLCHYLERNAFNLQRWKNIVDDKLIKSLISIDLQITEPAVYINAHDAAVRKRMKQWVSIPSSTPVEVPNTICAVTPTTITFRGLMLQFIKEAKEIIEKKINTKKSFHNISQPLFSSNVFILKCRLKLAF